MCLIQLMISEIICWEKESKWKEGDEVHFLINMSQLLMELKKSDHHPITSESSDFTPLFERLF